MEAPFLLALAAQTVFYETKPNSRIVTLIFYAKKKGHSNWQYGSEFSAEPVLPR
jgi:hypothetical protein